MALATGISLGPYEILAPLGAGGMGEVYRARDTRLGREVAVKVLPGDVSSSEAWRKRFEREAKAISKLAHPHVCALFDVGRQGDVDYLVMELLTGVTLATRLAKGPLPFEEVLRFGTQIASALAATHAMGIAHGDLKPSNVMLTKSGVKLLDYGVARPLPLPSARDVTWESTASHVPAANGEVVGTFPYMAPEQFEGKTADAHTDVFALGAVLFEMASGERAFPGRSPAEVISAVRTMEPPLVSSLQPASPTTFDRLVRNCLAKHPEERWNSAHDVGLLLRQLSEGRGDAPAAGASRRRWALLPWAVALLAFCGATAALLRPFRDGKGRGAPVRFLLAPPAGHSFFWSPESNSVALSPDGSQIAYITVNPKKEKRLWIRSMDQLDARPVPSTEGVKSVFWSPDGRSIGFFANGMLKRIDLPDGAAVVVCPVTGEYTGPSGTWGKGGDILFGGGNSIMRVSASGGVPAVAVEADASAHEILRYPWFLPDGERFLYLAGQSDDRVLMLATPGRAPEKLIPVGSKVQFTEPGFILFAREGVLLAQGFDWRRGKVSGTPFTVARQVRGFQTAASAEYATALNGTLVLQTVDDSQRLALLDASGRELATLARSSKYYDFTISPSGERVAFSRSTPGPGTIDLWSVDVERGVETRITSDPDNEFGAIWLPGEKAFAYSSGGRVGSPHLMRRDLQTEKDVQLLPVRHWQRGQDVSPDGSSLLYTESGTVWRLPLSGEGAPSAVLASSFTIVNVRFSPDGKYIAYISDESGEDQAYVTPYPGPGEKQRISSSGAAGLQWKHGTIYYSDVEGRLWSVPVSTQPGLRIEPRSLLFTAKSLMPRPYGTGPDFDVFPDGKRFLVAVPEVTANELPLTVVVNWSAATPN
jgi:eukaryotic-like serine/threonine-protein kinase